MPNKKASVRSVKSDAERRARNYSVRSAIKTSIRKVEEAARAGKPDEAKNLLTNAASIIDKAAAKGVIHKNTAARKKSRLARRATTAQQAQ